MKGLPPKLIYCPNLGIEALFRTGQDRPYLAEELQTGPRALARAAAVYLNSSRAHPFAP